MPRNRRWEFQIGNIRIKIFGLDGDVAVPYVNIHRFYDMLMRSTKLLDRMRDSSEVIIYTAYKPVFIRGREEDSEYIDGLLTVADALRTAVPNVRVFITADIADEYRVGNVTIVPMVISNTQFSEFLSRIRSGAVRNVSMRMDDVSRVKMTPLLIKLAKLQQNGLVDSIICIANASAIKPMLTDLFEALNTREGQVFIRLVLHYMPRKRYFVENLVLESISSIYTLSNEDTNE